MKIWNICFTGKKEVINKDQFYYCIKLEELKNNFVLKDEYIEKWRF